MNSSTFIPPYSSFPPSNSSFLPSSSSLACLSPRDTGKVVASREKRSDTRDSEYERQGKNERKFERTKDKKRFGTEMDR